MKTSSISEVVRTTQVQEIQRAATNQAQPKTSQPTPQAPAGDKVQISDAGRALAAKAAETGSELTPERIAEVREKILSGAYNSLEIVDQVARNMVASGDI
jgi:anti-sigma28 factor (negative regulator of flagellin synthesis)